MRCVCGRCRCVTGVQDLYAAFEWVREACESNIGVLGYTVPYAIGNVLLTVSGPVVVAIMHSLRS
jgi:putative transport protein